MSLRRGSRFLIKYWGIKLVGSINAYDEVYRNEIMEVVCFHQAYPVFLWRLADKGFLYAEFRSGSDPEKLVERIERILYEIESSRKEKLGDRCCFGKEVGRILIFDPFATMYDGVAEEATNGFFDADDTPPPEFWIGLDRGRLVVFIPEMFLALASVGVESCLGGSLEWGGDRFGIAC